MNLVFILIALCLWTASSSAASAFKLQLDHAGLTGPQQAASRQLLHSVEEVLPPRLKQHLGRHISLRWTESLPYEVMGKAFNKQILLNRRWLDSVVQNREAIPAAGLQDQRLKRELQKTLVRELAHFYDQGRFLSAHDRRLTNRCGARRKSIGAVGLPVECLGQTQRRFTFSDDPRLLELAGWPMKIGGRGEAELQNNQYLRSPDSHEIISPNKFVAVNLEYFLLDPEYPCRRPSLYYFFTRHFDWSPVNRVACGSGYTFLNAGLDAERPALGTLDSARIYQVHYLLAEPGDVWASRWGHSMLRVVICAPGREMGPGCQLDLDHHLVLSFQPVVGNAEISSWDGLTGGYPVRLFLLPLREVIKSYTKLQLRSLQSFPLTLSRDEQLTLVERAIELHWSYDGAYYFLGNNCVMETLKLLRSGTDRHLFRRIESVTPSGLLTLLKANGLIDDSVLTGRAQDQALGYYFESYRERYRLMFEVVRARLGVPEKKLEDWLALSAPQRQAWIDLSDQRSAVAMLLLEQAAYRRQVVSVLNDFKEGLVAPHGSADEGLATAIGLRSQLRQDSIFLGRPSDLLKTGYGIPQASARQQLAEISASHQQGLLALAAQLDERALAMVGHERRAALEASNHNVALLGERIRQLHLEAGGLMLP